MSVKGVVIRDEEVVLLRNERDEWELPGGKLELCESPEQCLTREIAEELRLDIVPESILDSWIYTIVPGVDVLVLTYGCVEASRTEAVMSNEHKELRWFPLAEIASLRMPEGYKTSIRSWSARAMTLLLPLLAAIGCRQPSKPDLGPAAFRTVTAGADWELTGLEGQPAPTGAGGRRATIRFEPDTARVAGFAGCNRYFGTYTLDGKTIRFGRIGMTMMACPEGMTLEQQLAAALEATRTYVLDTFELTVDANRVGQVNRLTLVGVSGPVAEFRRPTP